MRYRGIEVYWRRPPVYFTKINSTRNHHQVGRVSWNRPIRTDRHRVRKNGRFFPSRMVDHNRSIVRVRRLVGCRPKSPSAPRYSYSKIRNPMLSRSGLRRTHLVVSFGKIATLSPVLSARSNRLAFVFGISCATHNQISAITRRSWTGLRYNVTAFITLNVGKTMQPPASCPCDLH